MPTKAQMDGVLTQLERLQITGMSQAELSVATEGIDWSGFSESQRRGVELRISEGEEPDFWMNGIEAAEPAGIYRVWHKEGDGFVHAINVESGNLLGALVMPLVREGEFGSDRVTCLIEGARSTTFGDVIVNPDGAAYEIHNHKGVGPGFKGIDFQPPVTEQEHPVRPLTNDLINAVLLDVWPGNAAVIDFGIDSTDHLGALQFAIRHGLVTPQELDAAMGNGAKLTEIVQRGQNPYRDVTFRTSWDELRLEPPDEPAGKDEQRPPDTPPDHRGLTERILFGNGSPSPAPQPERASRESSRDGGGMEM